MLRAINRLMGVTSGLKLKKNEAGGVGGKREARRKCLSWGMMEYWQHHPRFHTEAKWAMVIIPGPCCVTRFPISHRHEIWGINADEFCFG